MARTIAVANQKGGVGKTTTAVNLAACLAAAEKRVLLIDLDSQANATSGLGLSSGPACIYEVLLGQARLADILQPTELACLFAATSHERLAGAEVELADLPARERLLQKALEPHLQDYEYIIVDCPPGLGMLTVNALTAAHSVLVPLQCEYYALEGLTRLIGTLDLVRKRLNPALSLEGIVLTMFDRRNNLSLPVADDVRSHFPGKVFQTVIPRNVRLAESPSHGRPIILYDIASTGAQSYIALATELMDKHL